MIPTIDDQLNLAGKATQAEIREYEQLAEATKTKVAKAAKLREKASEAISSDVDAEQAWRYVHMTALAEHNGLKAQIRTLERFLDVRQLLLSDSRSGLLKAEERIRQELKTAETKLVEAGIADPLPVHINSADSVKSAKSIKSKISGFISSNAIDRSVQERLAELMGILEAKAQHLQL